MIIPKLERFLYFYILHVPSNLAFKVTARFASVGGRPLSVLLVIKRRIHVSGLWMLERYGCPYFITTKPDSTAFIGQSVYIYTHIHTYIHTHIHTYSIYVLFLLILTTCPITQYTTCFTLLYLYNTLCFVYLTISNILLLSLRTVFQTCHCKSAKSMDLINFTKCCR